MEWNARPPSQWDWENLAVLNTRMDEHDNKFHPTIFQSNQGMNFGSYCSAGDDINTGGLVSELIQTSPKSSKSVSITSSSPEESRTSKITLVSFEAPREDFGNKIECVEAKDANTCAILETSICSSEPMLSLKLGKRAYFEDASVGNHTKPSFPIMHPEVTRKRCKSVCQNTPSPHCQVEGCNIDLSNVKDYYRKHRVCQNHSKSPKVIIGGIERRFCQQCSRFHSLPEFDEKKRSCRRRLSNHNARRRKLQSKAISLNPARLSCMNFERQQIGLLTDELSLVYPRPEANSTWEVTSKHSQCSKHVLNPEKTCGMTGQLYMPRDEMRSANSPYHDSSKLLSCKGAATKVLDTGLEGYVISSNLHTAQDLHRALSLLSTDLRGQFEAKLISPDNPSRPDNSDHTNETSMSHMAVRSLPFASVDSECWCNEQQALESQMQILDHNNEGNSFFQDFQLFKSPCEIEVYSNQ